MGAFSPVADLAPGGSRVRLVQQSEAGECGLACLTMVANYHGLDADLGSLRRRFALSARGAGLRTLIDCADRLGLVSRAVGVQLEQLAKLQLPAILHWNMNHFVVLERTGRRGGLIHDPDGRSRWMKLTEISRHFTGVAMELRPGETFERAPPKARLRIRNLWMSMRGMKSALVQTLLLSAILQAFVLASPYYMQVAIDNALPALDYDLLTVLAIGFGMFTLINAAAALLRGLVLLNAGSAVGFGLAVNITRRLFRLPVAWFEKRNTGDILSRYQSITPIQQMLTEGAVASVVDGLLAIFTLAVMFFYSPLLALIAVTAFAAYGGIRLLTFSLQRQSQEEAIVAGGKEQSTLIESIRGMTTLRLFDRETLRHALWQSKRADAVNADVRLARLAIWQGIGHSLVFGIETVLTIWLAVGFVIGGEGFSVGMIFAYMAYKVQFTQKSESLITQLIRFRMLRLHLERLSEIALADEDRSFQPAVGPETELEGRIELRGVSYRYSQSDPLVLNGVDLTVEPGEHVAITGVSGGGKSTLVKILLGLAEPARGELLVDGVPLERFGYKSYHRQIAGVLQEDTLFAGSLADNIALFDERVDMDRVVAAATDAAIHDDIMAMPMRYETWVGEMGSTLSGGQKQRVLLARALYRQPRILIMDEGTAHLDAEHERRVNAAVAKMGITRIVVAHRRETLACADRVLEMSGGRLCERDPGGEAA